MARINIEDSVFKDHRYADLCIAAGSRVMAVGALSCLWIEAQKYYLKHGEIPLDKWEASGLPEYLITTGWAERTLTGVRASGQDDQFAWLRQTSAAGKASSEARKAPKTPQRSSNARSTGVELVSTSYSSSSSNKKENTTTTDLSGLPDQIKKAWGVWNETLETYQIQPKRISPDDERIIAQAILHLGFDRVANALEGKRYEEKSQDYNPKSQLSLEYCLARNPKTRKANHERLENLALSKRSAGAQAQGLDETAKGKL